MTVYLLVTAKAISLSPSNQRLPVILSSLPGAAVEPFHICRRLGFLLLSL